jgi:carbonic anhydrase
MKGLKITLALALAFVAGACALQRGSKGWSYDGDTGPEHWSELSPDYALAGTGAAQSPIDITGARPGDVEPIEFHYAPTTLRLSNDGRRVRMDFDEGSYLLLGGSRFDLEYMEFHTPSEHSLAGRRYAVEAQLYHADTAGRIVAVAVLFGPSVGSDFLAGVCPHMPVAGDRATVPDVTVNPLDLLPVDRTRYEYKGSLTTPPCTEGVKWVVLARPVAASMGQIDRIRFFHHGNSRPTQPLNGRRLVVGE